MKNSLNLHCLSTQGSFISEMKWTPFKSLFWNTKDSIGKLTISFISGVFLWDRPFYLNVNLWQRQQMLNTYDNIKLDFLWW